MATKRENEALGSAVAQVRPLVARCEMIAIASITYGEPWLPLEIPFSWFRNQPDFARARQHLLTEMQSLLQETARMRLENFDPALIEASGKIRGVQRCCQECVACNSARVARGEAFECLVRVRSAGPETSEFRYTLSAKGVIHERR